LTARHKSATPIQFLQTDDLGRLISVCERSVTTQANGTAPTLGCNPDYNTYKGFVTNYTYDPLNRLTKVAQVGLQNRTFAYDGLSRVTSEFSPESGTKTYVYDSTTLGDLHTRTAPLENASSGTSVSTYTFDLLHRPTKIVYSDGLTPTANFAYDTGSIGSNAYNKGRLVQEWSGNTTLACPWTGESYDNDVDGNVILKTAVPLAACGTRSYTSHFGYNYLDQPTTITDIWGTLFTTSYDAVARPYQLVSSFVDATHPATLFNVSSFNPLGEVVTSLLGLGTGQMTRTNAYDKRGRLTSITDGSVYSLALTYGTNGKLATSNDSINGNYTSITYDDLGRMASASCTANCPNGASSLAYAYTYDQFGNRWTQARVPPIVPGQSLTFDSYNHITPTTCPASTSTVCYDGAGNMLSDGKGGIYLYDANGHITSTNINSGAYINYYGYDAIGQRNLANFNGTVNDVFFDQSGHENTWATSTDTVRNASFLYLGDQQTTYVGGDTYFAHANNVGSVVTRSNTAGSTSGQQFTYLPFGEMAGGGYLPEFAGNSWDYDNSTNNTPARQYAYGIGRWLSPDPSGDDAADPNSPQTWNEYAYVLNNPMSLIDIDGLDCGDPSSNSQNGDLFKVTVHAPCNPLQNFYDYVSSIDQTIIDRTTQVTTQVDRVIQNVVNWVNQPRDPGCLAGAAATGASMGAVAGGTAGGIGGGAGGTLVAPGVGTFGGAAAGASEGAALGAEAGYAAGIAIGSVKCAKGMGSSFGGNQRQNKQANDAKRTAERETGKKMTNLQQEKFHDLVTKQGYGYNELVSIARDILNGTAY
jgi:RHS repeat-associated protein